MWSLPWIYGGIKEYEEKTKFSYTEIIGINALTITWHNCYIKLDLRLLIKKKQPYKNHLFCFCVMNLVEVDETAREMISFVQHQYFNQQVR